MPRRSAAADVILRSACEHVLLAHIAAQHAREGARRAGMALAVFENAVGSDRYQRVTNRHHAALPLIACEAAGGQALAGGRLLQVAEGDATLPRLPAFAENSRSDVGGL